MKALPRLLSFLFVACLVLASLGTVHAAELMPPAPTRYFNDYAHLIPGDVAATLNQQLESLEKEGSSQIVVAIFPTMQSSSSIEDYTVRVARSWKVGQKNNNNGAVLFVFVKEHKAFIQVGYGLEGRLTDVLCKRIIEDELVPLFKARDYAGGLRSSVQAMILATRGEYTGDGRTQAQRKGGVSKANLNSGSLFTVFFFGIVLLVIISRVARSRSILGSRGYSSSSGPWFGDSGGSSSDGGGFSGGGGDFGGGGAGGSW